MNKSDLIAALSKEVKVPKTEVSRLLDAALSIIVNKVAQGETVSLLDFGSFKAVHRKARPGRNPRTGETVLIEAGLSTKFTIGRAFKTAVSRK